jgi:hypothetical protein
MAGIRPVWPDPAKWQDSGQIGRQNLADRIPSPDSGDINRMLDFDTDNISMVVGCLNVKVDCAV